MPTTIILKKLCGKFHLRSFAQSQKLSPALLLRESPGVLASDSIRLQEDATGELIRSLLLTPGFNECQADLH